MNQEKTKQPNKVILYRKRTLSRLMAIQIFYQFEFYEKSVEIETVKEDLIDNYVLDQKDSVSSFRKKIDINLLNSLLTGITLTCPEIDHDVSGFLKDGWDLDKLPDIMLYILRFGAFELKFMRDIPLKVVLDEYVDIAACFFEPKKVTFANGALENLAKEYRPEEFEKVKNHRK